MESISIRLPSQFLPGSATVLTDSLSRPHQLPHPEWSIHMTVFLFLRRLWPVQMVSLPPRPLIVVRFTSPLSGIRSQQARTRFSSSGTAFRLPRSIRWLSSASYRVAPGLHGDGTHSCDSPLGSAPLVSALVQLSLAPPVILPSRLGLLRLTRSRHLYPDLSWLRLRAWRLSSAFQKQLASPPLLRSSLRWRAVHPRAQCIRYDGPFIIGGVTPRAIPFLILPLLC